MHILGATVKQLPRPASGDANVMLSDCNFLFDLLGFYLEILHSWSCWLRSPSRGKFRKMSFPRSRQNDEGTALLTPRPRCRQLDTIDKI